MADEDIVTERGRSYGGEQDRYSNLYRIAGLWSAYLGTDVTAHDVCWMMTLLKASRAKQDPANDDNILDAHGYLTLAEKVR